MLNLEASKSNYVKSIKTNSLGFLSGRKSCTPETYKITFYNDPLTYITNAEDPFLELCVIKYVKNYTFPHLSGAEIKVLSLIMAESFEKQKMYAYTSKKYIKDMCRLSYATINKVIHSLEYDHGLILTGAEEGYYQIYLETISLLFTPDSLEENPCTEP